MNAERQKTVAFAVCGSFCTLGAAVPQAARLAAEGWRVLPVMSFAAAGTDTRFGSAAGWKARPGQGSRAAIRFSAARTSSSVAWSSRAMRP